MFGTHSDFNIAIIAIIIAITVIVLFHFSKKKPKGVQLLMGFMTASLFLYSGFGISLKDVDNNYIIFYVIFMIFLFLPFSIIKIKENNSEFSDFDKYILRKKKTIKGLSYFYLFLNFIPCIFPSFRLGNIFQFFSPGNLIDIFDTMTNVRNDIIYKLSNTLSLLFVPFFYIHIGLLVKKNRRNVAVGLIIMDMLLNFCPTSYLGRGKLMIYSFFILFVLFPPIKNGEFVKKTFIILLSFVVASVPILYFFVFFRLNQTVDTVSYGDILNELLLSEFTYPQYYDIIMKHNMGLNGIIMMIFWIICLPIPSIIWASKPVIDKYAFTTMITGLQYGDRGFSILLPSALGESIQFGGIYFFWAYAFIVGFIYALFAKFFVQNKLLHFNLLYCIICCVELGRSGAGAILPFLINGNLSLLIMYYIYRRNH